MLEAILDEYVKHDPESEKGLELKEKIDRLVKKIEDLEEWESYNGVAEDDGTLFRDGDEENAEGETQTAGSTSGERMSIRERITETLVKAAAENKEKTVDVYGIADTSLYRIGQEVNVTASMRVGMNAVLLAFVIPFVILLVVLFIGSRFIPDEAVVALLSIACLIPYYVGLYLMRSRLRERFTFRIE
jgi:sigma-E factor negative regulatory protein RseC